MLEARLNVHAAEHTEKILLFWSLFIELLKTNCLFILVHRRGKQMSQ